MKLRTQKYELIGANPNYIIIHPRTAEDLDIDPSTLVELTDRHQALMVITSPNVEQGCVGIKGSILDKLEIGVDEEIEFKATGVEGVTRLIRKKIRGVELSKKEIDIFISAIDTGLLQDAHIAAFGTAIEIVGMTIDEITNTAESIIKYSNKLVHKKQPVVDKHSIGGIAGNRITPIMVPTIAAAGLVIPKSSTRAITSPAGTVDALETAFPVELNIEEVAEVLEKTGGCMVDGQKLGLGDAADKFLRVVKQVKLDPKEMMLASIMSKKKAAGSKYVLIDLPTGRGSKLPTRQDARSLAHQFSTIGDNLGMHIESVVSPGDNPIGTMIGPALEMKEALLILKQKGGAYNLRKKSLSLSGLIFEMVGKAERGKGYDLAKRIWKSGRAYEKFKEIVEAQGGDPNIRVDDIETAKYTHTIHANEGDKIFSLNSYNIGMMARAAGAPFEKAAGVVLHTERGAVLERNDAILTIHANSEGKIDEAIAMMRTAPPFIMEQAILEHITSVAEDVSFD